MLNWLLTLEEAGMLQTVSRLLPELPLFLMTAVATHLVMSFAQTLMHYKLGHHPMGGKFFRNHIENTRDPTVKPEVLELAAVCEEVGDRIDDHAIQNEPHDTLISAGLTWGTGGSGAQSTAACLSYRQRGRTMTRRGLST